VNLIPHIDPTSGQEAETLKPDEGVYLRTCNGMESRAREVARHGVRFIAPYDRWYPQWALNSADTDKCGAALGTGGGYQRQR
jgi:hypothetical protein